MDLATLALLGDAALAREFDAGSWRRGRQYAAAGRVHEVGMEEDGDLLHLDGQVSGTHDYLVGITVHGSASRPRVDGECSCPVGWNCKHVVAVLLTARNASPAGGSSPTREPAPVAGAPLARVPDLLPAWRPTPPAPPPPPSWGQLLEGALADPRGGDVREPSPLALQAELRAPDPVGPGRGYVLPPTVLLRPLRRGARDNWVKTGATWNDVPAMRFSGGFDPEQVAVLHELRDLRSLSAHYARAGDGLDVADLGPALWPLLRRVRESGLAVVPVAPLHSLVLDEEVALDLDVREAGDETLVEVVVRGHDRPSGSRLRVYGEPGHGVLLLAPVEQGRGRWAARLAPLSHRPTYPVRRLADEPEPVRVPAADRERFRSAYLPRLRRHAPVVSSDESVALPEVPEPRLVLGVTWRAADRVGLSWHWRYATPADPGRARECGLHAEDTLDGLRDLAAEHGLLTGLRLGEHGDRLLRRDGSGSALLGDVLLGRGDVLTFVHQVLPELHGLEAAGAGVLVEEHGERPDYREAVEDPQIRFEVVERAAPDGTDGADGTDDDRPTDWLDLEVVIEVDGEQVPLAAVLEALTWEHEVVFLPSGRYVRTDHPALTRLAETVRAAGEIVPTAKESDRLRVSRHDLGTWGELADLGVVDHQAEQWVQRAHALRDLTDLPQVEPTGLTSALRPYQLDGFRWLAFLWESGLGGVLADDMGLGKTLQTLALVRHATERGSGRFLVVAPTSVVPGWVSEAARHVPGLRVRAVTGTARRRGTTIAEEAEGVDVLVTSYTLLRLEAPAYAALDWGGLVLDEAHQVKNHRGKTYQAVRSLDVPFRLGLTGTPFENRLMELWALLSIVAPGLYPWPRAFVDQVVNPVEKRGDAEALARFRRRIRPFPLRRTKELVAADLPPKQEQVLEVGLEPQHRKVYDAHLQRERQEVLGLVEDFERNRIAIFGALTRLRQLSLDPALVDPAHEAVGSAKTDVLVDHLRELAAEGHRALVFSQFTSFLGRVRARLDTEGIASTYLDGSTRDRAAVLEEFRTGDAPVFLISLKAGGVGLTLTEADYVFVLDPWWNPAVEAQAVDRAHRIGQQRPVHVYRLVATDTIEEKVMALKERKAALFQQVVDGDGALSGAVTADDVRALFGA